MFISKLFCKYDINKQNHSANEILISRIFCKYIVHKQNYPSKRIFINRSFVKIIFIINYSANEMFVNKIILQMRCS